MAYTTIDDPSVYFQTALYTGDGASSNAITNGGNSDLQPDWLWIKNRSSSGGTGPNIIFDSTRGPTKDLHTNNNEAEHTNSNTCKSFNTDGFTVGDSGAVNNNTDTFVAWQWKANGGTTSSNSDGSITSTVQANTTSGFSVVTYTGNGSNGATVGHGLGFQPQMVWVKRREGTANWCIKTTLIDDGDVLFLDIDSAKSDTSTPFNDTDPNTTTFTIGDNQATNANGGTYVAYCFAEKQGYSKFGSYTGNADNDGTFVYTGFSPAWLMIKGTDSAQQWNIHDSKRREYNSNTKYVFANLSNAEATSSNLAMDFLSNGFKLRSSDDAQNNGTYIYMAFAESPFVSSKGVPTTAR